MANTVSGNTPKKLSPLIVGLLEIVFIIILLILVFLPLQFFHVINVSSLFFHASSTSQQTSSPLFHFPPSNQPTPSITPALANSPDSFTYDPRAAQQNLKTYIPQVLQKKYVPASLQYNQRSLTNNDITTYKGLFQAQWSIPNNPALFIAMWLYKKNTNTPAALRVYIDTHISSTTGIASDNSKINQIFTSFLRPVLAIPFTCNKNSSSPSSFFCTRQGTADNLPVLESIYTLPETKDQNIIQLLSCKSFGVIGTCVDPNALL